MAKSARPKAPPSDKALLSTGPRRRLPSSLLKAPIFLLLTAAARALSTPCLAPVYGSLNSHDPINGLLSFSAVICTLLFTLLDRSPQGRSSETLGLAVTGIGSGQSLWLAYSTGWSGTWGPRWGPLIARIGSHGALTIAVSLYALVTVGQLMGTSHHGSMNRSVALLSLLSLFTALGGFEIVIVEVLQRYQSLLFIYGPYGLQVLLSGLFALLAEKVWLGHLAFFLMVVTNVHIQSSSMLSRVNTALASDGYKVLERGYSVTGYVSVLENVKDGFRAMRCDHSLLGGEWVGYPSARGVEVREPIYAVFVTLEAVRLVIPVDTRAAKEVETSDNEQALVIGLGIGTSATALIHHGVATTVVEIDPVVHRFAIDHFSLPADHTPVLQDAVSFISSHQITHSERYNYIIHDVFTGGAEPLELFTIDFIRGLSDLLKPDGTIAINYAGDLLLPSAASVVLTSLAVFPSCQLFRETEAPSQPVDEDVANMIIFCRKQSGPFHFRDPTEGDFLGTHTRREFLKPRFEVSIEGFREGKGKVIEKGEMKWLKDSQRRNLQSHWTFMRGVVADKVWEYW